MGKKKKSKDHVKVEEKSSSDPVLEESGASKSLYDVLGVEKTASQQEIKKAYHKLALRFHPDKNPGDDDAKEKFQWLQKVISILGDPEKRTLYDQTGCTDDDAFPSDAVDGLHEYFRAMYKKVTEEDIIEFESAYRGSDSEKKDLMDLYRKFKGNMDKVFTYMICCDEKLDSHRFKDIIEEAIAAGELKAFQKYKKWADDISKRKPPIDPIKKRGKSKKGGESDLLAVISKRREARKEDYNAMCSSFMARYVDGDCDLDQEPSEAEFLAARKRIEARKKSSKRKRNY